METLNGLFGETIAQIISFFALFAIILAAIYILYMVIKSLYGKSYIKGERSKAPRLTVTDAATIDSRRRIVLIRRDNVEHLILIGGPSDLVIEQNIVADLSEQLSEDSHLTSPSAAMQHATPSSSWPEIEVEPSQPPHEAAAESFESPARVQPANMSASKPVSLPTEPQLAPEPTSQHQLQTYAQQVAAAQRQQQAQQQRNAQPARTAPNRHQEEQNQAPKLHPAYPLGQVARGVVAATSGLAAANNAAQQELIAAAKLGQNRALATAPSLKTTTAPKPPSQPLSDITPASNRAITERPISSETVKENSAFDLNLELENAVAAALSPENLSFEEMLSSEMDLQFNRASAAHSPALRKDHESVVQSGLLDIPARK